MLNLYLATAPLPSSPLPPFPKKIRIEQCSTISNFLFRYQIKSELEKLSAPHNTRYIYIPYYQTKYLRLTYLVAVLFSRLCNRISSIRWWAIILLHDRSPQIPCSSEWDFKRAYKLTILLIIQLLRITIKATLHTSIF